MLSVIVRPLPAALALLLASSLARADGPGKQACFASFVSGQRSRQAGALLDAKRDFTTCASEACPVEVRSTCGRWVREVDVAVPTIVLAAKDGEGHDLIDVRVSVDGAPFSEALDGRARPIDPGIHTFRFERGRRTTTLRTAIREGQKSQAIVGRFAPDPPPAWTGPSPGAPLTRPVPTAAYVFGGFTIVGAGVFAGFALAGRANLSVLDGKACAPRCNEVDPASVSAVRRSYVIADIGLATAIVSLGLTTYFYLTRPEVRSR